MCSVGFAGKMSNNIGKDVLNYEVTDPSDNALNPQPGTLRYGATMIRGKKMGHIPEGHENQTRKTIAN